MNGSEVSMALTKVGNGQSTMLSAKQVLENTRLIQQVMESVMKENTHYGVIPGTENKPNLFKAGAEKLCMVFRLAPEFEFLAGTINGDDHIRYVVKCTLRHISTGDVYGTGIGSCSSREKKYATRSVYENRATPEERAGALRKDIRSGQRGEYTVLIIHQNPYDVENTILKMAQKRALVAATLVATAASDIFTQDLEDLTETAATMAGDETPRGRQPQQKPAGKSAAGKGTAPASAPNKGTASSKNEEASPPNGNGLNEGQKKALKQLFGKDTAGYEEFILSIPSAEEAAEKIRELTRANSGDDDGLI